MGASASFVFTCTPLYPALILTKLADVSKVVNGGLTSISVSLARVKTIIIIHFSAKRMVQLLWYQIYETRTHVSERLPSHWYHLSYSFISAAFL